MNPLNDYPGLRKKLYQLQFVVAGVLLLIGVGYGAAGNGLPQWYAVVGAVATALWTYLGLTAATNVATVDDDLKTATYPGADDVDATPISDEAGYVNQAFLWGVGFVLLVLIFLAVFGVL